MQVGIIDVGSNTVRLLVARRLACGTVEPVLEERAQLGLGAEIELHGRISEPKLTETARRARRYAKIARAAGCDAIEVVVTAPGRQSGNAEHLLWVLEQAADAPVRVLSAQEEGRLAYVGAVGRASLSPGRLAVCDVGGGSTEVVVGRDGIPPYWLRSFDIGSLRLTGRYLDADPAGRRAVRAAREHVRETFDGLDPPTVDAALVTGGTGRALRKLVGRRLGSAELDEAVAICCGSSAVKVGRRFGVDRERARTLAAGAIILGVVRAHLGVDLVVARGGLREGLADRLLALPIAA
jgi:exopolyphosphatase / guanosine-5'-triphosphate,3'-diphosphate pyrophosphatase